METGKLEGPHEHIKNKLYGHVAAPLTTRTLLDRQKIDAPGGCAEAIRAAKKSIYKYTSCIRLCQKSINSRSETYFLPPPPHALLRPQKQATLPAFATRTEAEDGAGGERVLPCHKPLETRQAASIVHSATSDDTKNTRAVPPTTPLSVGGFSATATFGILSRQLSSRNPQKTKRTWHQTHSQPDTRGW